MQQCLGRLVSDRDGKGRLQFVEGGYFHLEIRCENVLDGDSDMCEKCCNRAVKTHERADGHRLKGAHSAVLHGRVTESIPLWSHIFEGEWYNKQIKNGSTIDPDTMAKAKRAKELAQGGIDKFLVPAPASAAHAPAPAPPPAPPPAPAPAPAAPKNKLKALKALKAVKTITIPMPPPVARILPTETIEPLEIVEIAVRHFDHDGTSYYINYDTKKLYNKQLKYVGRWNSQEQKIDSYPDSD
jgi:hypothetical protein